MDEDSAQAREVELIVYHLRPVVFSEVMLGMKMIEMEVVLDAWQAEMADLAVSVKEN